jgi:hypothetical protein
MKKIRGDKPIWLIIHIFMQISQENSLGSYLYPSKLKCQVCLFVCFLFSFFFYKIREQEGGTSPDQGGGWHQWEEEGVGEKGSRVNTVQKICTHVYKCKNDTYWNYSRNLGEGGWWRMVEEVNSCMIYWIYCKNLWKCHNVPYTSQQ